MRTNEGHCGSGPGASVVGSTIAASLCVLLACGDPTPLGGDEHPLFFTLSGTPDAAMDALFQGRVVRDRAGCLRLGSASGATVIWPAGYSLRNGRTVVDGTGDTVGSIGGSFRLGGGEVPRLHDGIRVSEEVRDRAEARCPGRYWIVAGS